MVIAAAAAALRPTTSWLSYLPRHHTTMSFARPYGYIQDTELAKLWKQRDKNTNSIAVVDVRDDDFEGGNIPGCIHIPSSDFPDRVNELVKSPLKDGGLYKV
jgi:3-mercaptopyruvate sulfurtransferase SseA